MLTFKKITREADFDSNLSREDYVNFLYKHLDEFGDSREAINKCIDFAFELNGGLGGSLYAVYEGDQMVGALIINNTGMSEFIPEHILVYVAVDSKFRGKGYGREIVEHALKECPGNVKLHVEYENPAKRLYERIGFTSKYAELRYNKK
ncbi:MAG: GNAT family N-acetyltransferase [Lentimicrobiaceae bacterium]|nr:GNAT family N-acetyltransferase [Lentimicrobiaceae bacterium]